MYRFYRFMYGLVGFSRSQTNGFILFLPLLLVILFSEPAFRYFALSTGSNHALDIARLDSLVNLLNAKRGPDNSPVSVDGHLVPFDPNAVSPEEMKKLGISMPVISRIVNYRNKGGRFRVRKDLLKIWGFDSAVYGRIEKHILLPNVLDKKSDPGGFVAREAFPARIDVRKNEAPPLEDLNSADSASLKKVYGIGEKLAARILKYREALGGFVSMDQVREVYRLDSSVIRSVNNRFFVRPGFAPRKLNINKAGRLELAAHPYLSSKVADAIVSYRFNHGEFRRIEDLRKIPAMDSVMFWKAQPYLMVDENE